MLARLVEVVHSSRSYRIRQAHAQTTELQLPNFCLAPVMAFHLEGVHYCCHLGRRLPWNPYWR